MDSHALPERIPNYRIRNSDGQSSAFGFLGSSPTIRAYSFSKLLLNELVTCYVPCLGFDQITYNKCDLNQIKMNADI